MQQELGITFVHVTHTQLEAIAVADMVVVMTHGRIEQEGTAQEIYTQPRSAYVARFMGGHNVFSGHVVALANGSARLMSDSGELYAVPMQSMSTDEAMVVWFSVRRDRIELTNASQGSAPTPIEPNTVCGTVQAIEYQGSYVKVTIHRSGQEDVIAHVPDRASFPCKYIWATGWWHAGQSKICTCCRRLGSVHTTRRWPRHCRTHERRLVARSGRRSAQVWARRWPCLLRSAADVHPDDESLHSAGLVLQQKRRRPVHRRQWPWVR